MATAAVAQVTYLCLEGGLVWRRRDSLIRQRRKQDFAACNPEITARHAPGEVKKRFVRGPLYELAAKALPSACVTVRFHGCFKEDAAVCLRYAWNDLTPSPLHAELGITAVLQTVLFEEGVQAVAVYVTAGPTNS